MRGDRPKKKSRYSPEQVAFGMPYAEEGTPVSEVCRKMGTSDRALCRRKKKFRGIPVAEARRFRALEERRMLRRLVPISAWIRNAIGRVVNKF